MPAGDIVRDVTPSLGAVALAVRGRHAVLRPLFNRASRFDEHALHVRQFRILRLDRWIVSHLIGDELVRGTELDASRQKRRLVADFAAFGEHDVAFGAALVDRTPPEARPHR